MRLLIFRNTQASVLRKERCSWNVYYIGELVSCFKLIVRLIMFYLSISLFGSSSFWLRFYFFIERNNELMKQFCIEKSQKREPPKRGAGSRIRKHKHTCTLNTTPSGSKLFSVYLICLDCSIRIRSSIMLSRCCWSTALWAMSFMLLFVSSAFFSSSLI